MKHVFELNPNSNGRESPTLETAKYGRVGNFEYIFSDLEK